MVVVGTFSILKARTFMVLPPPCTENKPPKLRETGGINEEGEWMRGG
jgi:hypothetical protein